MEPVYFLGLFAQVAEQRVWISCRSLRRLGINPKGECVSACVFALVRQGEEEDRCVGEKDLEYHCEEEWKKAQKMCLHQSTAAPALHY